MNEGTYIQYAKSGSVKLRSRFLHYGRLAAAAIIVATASAVTERVVTAAAEQDDDEDDNPRAVTSKAIVTHDSLPPLSDVRCALASSAAFVIILCIACKFCYGANKKVSKSKKTAVI